MGDRAVAMRGPAIPVLFGALASIAATAWAIRASDGWGILWWLPCCVIAGLFHLVVHIRMILNMTEVSAGMARLALLSSAAFLVAFLLQVDVGDGPGWIIATALLPDGLERAKLPAWWPGWVNFLAFLPLIGTWALLVRRSSH